MRSWIQDIIAVGTSKVIMILSGLAGAIIVARVLGPEKNGIIESIKVYPVIIMSFGSMGISRSVTFLLGKGEYLESDIKKSVTQVWLFTSIASTLIAFLIIYSTNPFGVTPYLAFLAAIQIPFVLFNQYVSGIFLGKNEIRSFTKVQWVPGVLIFVLILTLIYGLGLGVKGYFIAFTLGPFAFSVYLFIRYKFFSYFNFSVNKPLVMKLLSLGGVYALALFIVGLNYKADIVLMTRLSTSEELGIYSKGVLIAEYLWQIPMLFGSLVIARSVTAVDGKVFSLKVSQLLRLSLVMIGLASFVLIVFSKTVVLLLYGQEFEASGQVLIFILPGVLMLTVYKVLYMDLAGRGMPWVAIKAMLPALLLNIVLNFIFIPDYGAVGAALSSTISYIIAAFLFLHNYSKVTDIRVKTILTYSKSDFNPIRKLLRI